MKALDRKCPYCRDDIKVSTKNHSLFICPSCHKSFIVSNVAANNWRLPKRRRY